MKALLISIILISSTQIVSQNKFEPPSGNVVSLGVSIYGPEFVFGSFMEESKIAGELFLAYHAVEWETDETIWNKPTTGGINFGWNIFTNYFSISQLKYFWGVGGVVIRERLGKKSYSKAGEPTTGHFSGFDIHLGSRYYFNSHFYTSVWVGYLVISSDAETMLVKAKSPIKEDWGKIALDLNIMYAF